MARYHEVAASLRERIQAGEFPIGSRLPPISRLQGEYDVSGLNTIREAQQRLVKEGLLEPNLTSTAVLPSYFRRGVMELQLPIPTDLQWQAAWQSVSHGV